MTDFSNRIYHVKLADDMPYDRWYAYMASVLISRGFRDTHCLSKTSGKSLLVPKRMMGNHDFENMTVLP